MSQPALTLTGVTVGSYQEHCYVLLDPATNQSIVFDPGAEPKKILTLIGESQVQAILLTHAHADHIGAVDDVRNVTGAPVSLHPADADLMGNIKVDHWLSDGDSITFGTHTIRAIHTPGHTAGMITFLLDDDRAIVGDTIFGGGPGRTNTPAEFRTTLDTLRTVILAWPDDTMCYPGHGEPFRIGDLRNEIQAFVDREHPQDFAGDAEWGS